MKLPIIVFDLGGVLIDWNPRHLYRKLFADEKLMEKFFIEVDFFNWNLLQDKGRPFTEAVNELSAKFPHHKDLIMAYQMRWCESIAGAIPEAVAIMERLEKDGYQLYALSNWSPETFPLVKDDYPFLNRFKKLFISGELGLIKPHPEIFQYMLKDIDHMAQECLFIDDSPTNIATANQLGFDAILFTSPAQLREELIKREILV